MYPAATGSRTVSRLERHVGPFTVRVSQNDPAVAGGLTLNVAQRRLPERHHTVEVMAVNDYGSNLQSNHLA
jgi:hypothetical protein